MVVYHFLLDNRVGGPHIYVKGLVESMEDEVASEIITLGNSPYADLALIKIRDIWSPLYVIEVIVNILVLIYWKYTGVINKNNVLFAVHGSANLSPLLVARIFRIPVIWHLHETLNSYHLFVKIGKAFLKNTRYKIAIVAHEIARKYELDDYVYLPAFVDTDFWTPVAVEANPKEDGMWLNQTGDKDIYRMLVVGNINPDKGVDVLLSALDDIHIDCHLNIVGNELYTQREYCKKLKNKVELIERGPQNIRVNFLGWRDPQTVRGLLATCDLFVLPSRSEACPIVLLEAMAMGCKIVASDVGDIKLILKDYPNSRIFKSEEYGDVQKSILSILKDKKHEAHVGELWQLSSVSKQAFSLYHELSMSLI